MKILIDTMSRVDELEAEIESFRKTDLGKGICMCGSDVNSHSWYDGHSPVDSHEYYIFSLQQEIEKLRALREFMI